MRARPRSFVGVGIATYALMLGVFAAVLFLLAIFPPLGLLLVPLFLILGLILLILCISGLSTLAVMLGDWLLRRNSSRMSGCASEINASPRSICPEIISRHNDDPRSSI